MSVPEEYEVETVIQARVFSKRKDKINWKYLVKWKGYGMDDATWEPPVSFNGGSEHMLERFWDRVDAGGRDIGDASLFKTGEEVFPKGPPRKAKFEKVSQDVVDEESAAPVSADVHEANDKLDQETKKSMKRRHSPEEDEPVKRRRGRPSKTESESATKSTRSLPHTNGDDIPPQSEPWQGPSPGPSTKIARKASGGTLDNKIILTSPLEDSVSKLVVHEQTQPAISRTGGTPLGDVNKSQVDDQSVEDESDDPLFDSPKANRQSSPRRSVSASGGSTPLPSHRARVANPLVKMVDEPNFGAGMDSAIAAKARLIGQPTAASNGEAPGGGPSRAPASKPGPGRSSQGLQTKNRSSLLVFQKGSLQTRKGKYRPSESNADVEVDGNGDDAMEVDGGLASDVAPNKAPTGQELLQMAGLNEADAEALPDFEDDVSEEVAPASKEALAQSSVAQAARNLFPAESSLSLFSSFNTPWKRSTIFDPLGFGASAVVASPQNMTSTSAPISTRPTFSLTLDSSVTVSIILKDIYQVTGSPSLDVVVAANPKGPPGKFYREGVASTLLDALRSGGSSARIELGEAIDEDHKQHFERFRGRLERGELFVGLAGHEVLAFWSSANTNVGQKLGAPEMLVGLSGTVVVSRVVIENYSAYADAACQAEHVRW